MHGGAGTGVNKAVMTRCCCLYLLLSSFVADNLAVMTTGAATSNEMMNAQENFMMTDMDVDSIATRVSGC